MIHHQLVLRIATGKRAGVLVVCGHLHVRIPCLIELSPPKKFIRQGSRSAICLKDAWRTAGRAVPR